MPRHIPRNILAAVAVCLSLILFAATWLTPVARSGAGANNASPPQEPANGSLFVRKLLFRANDVVHSSATGLLYASVPSTEGAAGNSVAVIDPATGSVSATVFIGSEPNRLALSDDGNTLYASLDGAFAIRRFDVPSQTPGAQFAVGGETFGGLYVVNDMAVSPGEPNVVAVARYYRGSSPPEAGVAIFDNGVRRTKTGPGHIAGADYLAYSATPSKLYGGGFYGGLRTMPIDAQGVGTQTMTSFNVGARIKFAGGLIYSSTGQVINPDAGTLLGTFPSATTNAFVPDPANGRAYYLVRENFGSGPLTLKAFDINTFLPLGTQTLTGISGDPTTMIRWGANGLAFRTNTGELYIVQTNLIPSGTPVPAPTPTPSPTPSPTPATAAAFVRQLPLEANDLVYHDASQRLYASVPSTAGAKGNSITPIDPAAGTVGASVFVGSEPTRLALADDGQTLYVGLNGSGAVRRFDLASQTAGAQFNLGINYDGPFVATDIAVMPGAPGTVAVARGNSGAVVYDDGVGRTQTGNHTGPVEFGATATRLYVGSSPVQKYSVGAGGLTLDGSALTGRGGATFFDRNTGLLFTSSGDVIDPEAGVMRGTFTGLGFGSHMAVDSAAGRVYFLTTSQNSSSTWLLRSYDLNTFRPIAQVNLGSINGTPAGLVRWGTNGLAFRVTSGFSGGSPRVFLVQTALVADTDPIPTPTPTPSPTPTPTPAYVPTFVRRVSVPANDLVYNQATARLYVSLPSAAGTSGNSITGIDPATGAVGPSIFIGSEPGKLALADDGRTLYTYLGGAKAVRRFDLQTQTAGLQFPVGQQAPADMEVVPGSPQSLAVSPGVDFSSGVTVYDDGVARPKLGKGNFYAVLPIEFGATPDVLYGYDSYSSGFELVKFRVDAEGVTTLQVTNNLISGYSSGIEFAGGRLYASSGRVVDPEARTLLGTFTGTGGMAFTVDLALGRVFFITDADFSSGNKVLRAYDINTFLPLGSVTINGAVGTPTSLVRWGTNGLAFRTTNTFSGINESQVYIIQSHLVSAAAPIPTGVHLVADRISAFEGSPSIQLTVTRSGEVGAATTVDYTTGGGTATAGQDYTATSGTLTFAAGELSKTVTIQLRGDNIYEGSETFNVTLSNPSGGAVFSGPATALVTISDDDSRPYVSSQTAQTVEGNSGTTDLSFNVVISNPSVETVSVNYATSDDTATAGTDYVATSGTLTFAPGTTSGVVKVPVKGDLTIEPNETFRLNFTGVVNGTLTFTSVLGQITNDDSAGALRFAANAYSSDEGDGAVTVTVTRVGGLSGAVSINYATGGGTATAGDDYTAASGTLAFAEGETSKSFAVTIADDAKSESDETVNLMLSSPTGGAGLGAPSAGVLTIRDNDLATFQFAALNYSAAEQSGRVELRVTRTGDSTSAATVSYATADGNAKDTSDYNLTLGTLRFNPGELEKTIVVLLTDDVTVEPPETFAVVLSAPSAPSALGTPATATVTVESDDASPAPNPMGEGFNAQFFVRQHYVDFFNREPDPSGLAFWTGELTSCGADAACLDVKKQNVSAAFFLSIEFQETGYFVYRMHQVAHNTGESLRMRDFMADSQEIGRGVTVGALGWKQQLDANKQAFAEQFVTRPGFLAAYQGLSNAQFVDALNANTLDPLAPSLGGVLTQAEREQLVADLDSSARTRTGVLRAVVENKEFARRQSNKAFVLMQYFGYLRRNPDDAPDTNFDGYNFWLRKLNEFGGNFVNAEMVKAFIVSEEYSKRFKQ